MDPKKAFSYCPKCGSSLRGQDDHLLICTSCSFHFYINPQPSTAALISNKDGDIMLVKRKHDPMAGYWDLPGGFMHPQESLNDSLRREIHEELGVSIQTGEIVGVYTDKYLYQGVMNATLCIAVEGILSEEETIIPNDDITEYAFFSKETIHDQPIAFPSMTDAINDYIKKRS